MREAAAAPLSSSITSAPRLPLLVSCPRPQDVHFSWRVEADWAGTSGGNCRRLTQEPLTVSFLSPSVFFFGLSIWTDSPGRTAAKGLDEPQL